MFEYRQVLTRMRLGDTDRAIARAGLMGRRKAAQLRLKLHPDCHVQFEKAYYSASFRLVRQHLWLRATETTVQLFHHHELVATHLRQFRPGSRCTIDEHLPPEAIAYKLRDPQWCLRQSEDIGAACHALIERLFAHRVLDNLRAAQSVIGLARRFGVSGGVKPRINGEQRAPGTTRCSAGVKGLRRVKPLRGSSAALRPSR